MKWLSRYILTKRIDHHYRMRDSIMYARGQDPISQYEYICHQDELYHRAACEKRCAERLEKLLIKYSI